MSFVMDLLMKEGLKHLPSAIDKIESSLGEDEAILIVPAKGRLVMCIGKFAPRVSDVKNEDVGSPTYVISTALDVPCRRYLIPDEIEKLISDVNG